MFGLNLFKKSHKSDYGEMRSHILHKPFGETIGQKMGMNDFPRDPYAPEPYVAPPRPFEPPMANFEPNPPFEQAPMQYNPQRRADPRTDFGEIQNEPKFDSKNYDILDRLNIIESQLQAIRSQTETINERLKNMDAKLQSRRY